MRLLLRAILLVVLVALVLVSLTLVLRPGSRQLAPAWLFYDLVGRRASTLPAPAEQWLLAQGQDFCNRGHDTDCGGYRVTGARPLTISPAAGSQGTAMAWCVDYAVLRRNTGRLTGQLIYWVSIPQSMIITQQNDGQYQGFPADRCDMTTLNP